MILCKRSHTEKNLNQVLKIIDYVSHFDVWLPHKGKNVKRNKI